MFPDLTKLLASACECVCVCMGEGGLLCKQGLSNIIDYNFGGGYHFLPSLLPLIMRQGHRCVSET